MSDPGSFEQHFHQRAELAENLYRQSWRNEAHLIASVALDSLSAVWVHDFPDETQGFSDAVRFRRFIQTFTSDPEATTMAVVLFAQDLAQHGSLALKEAARRILRERAADEPPIRAFEFGEWPHQHKDCSWEVLLAEEPCLAGSPGLASVATRYTYPALVYSFFRCGLAHTLQKGSRTHDFSGTEPDEEISYAPPMRLSGRTRPLGIKFGLKVLTGWLRTTSTNYVRRCEEADVRPAQDFDASRKAIEQLDRVWRKLV